MLLRKTLTMLVGLLAGASVVIVLWSDVEVAAAEAASRHFVVTSSMSTSSINPNEETSTTEVKKNSFPSSLKSPELNIIDEASKFEAKDAAFVASSASGALDWTPSHHPRRQHKRQQRINNRKRLWQKQRLRNKLNRFNRRRRDNFEKPHHGFKPHFRRPRRRRRRNFVNGQLRARAPFAKRRPILTGADRLTLEDVPDNGRGVKTNGYHKVVNQRVSEVTKRPSYFGHAFHFR